MNYRYHWREMANEHYNNILRSHNAGIYSSVIMNSGYPIECALKAALCNRTDEYLDPDKGNYKTHNFDSLLHKANLKDEFKREQKRSPKFKAYWSVVSKWSPELRYEAPKSKTIEKDSEKQIKAISDRKDGVRRWVENYW